MLLQVSVAVDCSLVILQYWLTASRFDAEPHLPALLEQPLGYISFTITKVDPQITTLIGPILGGVFTQDLTWRWCFYINLPLGAVTLIGILFLLQNPEALRNNKTFVEKLNELDYIGPLIFIPATICLFLALELGGSTLSWDSPVILSLLCGSVLMFPVWLWTQFRLKDRATVPTRVMKQKTVFFSCMFSFCTGAAFVVPPFYLPLYFQAIKGSGATESGVQILPLIIAGALSSLAGGIAISFVGYYTPFMVLGMAGCTIGLGLLTMLGVDTTYAMNMGFQILTGVFMGINFQVYSLDLRVLTGDTDYCGTNIGSSSRYPRGNVHDTLLQSVRRCNLSLYRPIDSPQHSLAGYERYQSGPDEK